MKSFKLLSLSSIIIHQTTTKSDPLDQLSGIWDDKASNLEYSPLNRIDSNANSPVNLDNFLYANDKMQTFSITERPEEITNLSFLEQKGVHFHGIIHLQLIPNANNMDENDALPSFCFEPRLWLLMPKTGQTTLDHYTSWVNNISFLPELNKVQKIASTTNSFQSDSNFCVEPVMENDATVATPIQCVQKELIYNSSLKCPPNSDNTFKTKFFINLG